MPEDAISTSSAHTVSGERSHAKASLLVELCLVFVDIMDNIVDNSKFGFVQLIIQNYIIKK